jgi:hypothetical protein
VVLPAVAHGEGAVGYLVLAGRMANGKPCSGEEVLMPTVAQYVELLADATGEPFPTVRMTARQQADGDVQPKASGRRVPNVTHEQAVMLLFAVMAAHPVKDATRTAKTYAALVHNGMPAGGETALEAVTRLLRRLPKESSGLDWSLEVCMNFPQVVLKKKVSTPQMAHPSERTDHGDIYIPAGEDWMHWPSDHLKRFAVLPGVGLYQIALALAEDA